MQRIQADFTELEQFEQHAQRAIDEIEHQLTDLAGFLARPARGNYSGRTNGEPANVATVSPKVDISPADVNSAAGTFTREQSTLDDTWDHLAQVLDAAHGMAGNDKAAATFAARYDPAAKAAWSAFGAGIRTLAGVANGLVTTANNYLKAEAHSTAGGSGTPQQFRPPAVLSDVVIHGPAPSKGDGDSGVPEFLQKFWPNGWNPQGGGDPDNFFFRRGDDVIVTKRDGTFVTILKGGIDNGWFKGASAAK